MIADGEFPEKVYDSGQQTLFLMYPRACTCTMPVQEPRGEMRRHTPGPGATVGRAPPWVLEPPVLPTSTFQSGPESQCTLCHRYVNCLIYSVCFTAQHRPHSHTCWGQRGHNWPQDAEPGRCQGLGIPSAASFQTPHTSTVYTASKVAKDFPSHNSSCLCTKYFTYHRIDKS